MNLMIQVASAWSISAEGKRDYEGSSPPRGLMQRLVSRRADGLQFHLWSRESEDAVWVCDLPHSAQFCPWTRSGGHCETPVSSSSDGPRVSFRTRPDLRGVGEAQNVNIKPDKLEKKQNLPAPGPQVLSKGDAGRRWINPTTEQALSYS